jgi:hypothetical protein
MNKNSIGLALLLLAPIAVVWSAEFGEAAKYLGTGSVLAVLLGVVARPVAPFALLLPFVYAAAALTAQSTDGVVALIVAIAAAVGAAGSLGLQRGLVALLGAALIGSVEPATSDDVLRRSAWMLAGASYGLLLVLTVLRRASVAGLAVRPQAAVGYALLLAVLVLVAWFAARLGRLAYPWWLPLAVVAVSEPVAARSPWHSMLRVAAVLCGTLVLVTLAAAVDAPALRVALLGVLMLAAAWQAARHPTLLALLLTPVLVLIAGPGAGATPLGAGLPAVLLACLPVFAAACLGHFAFWTLRAAPRRLPA